ncbi:hypothetical protein HDU67_008145, partial [Dinochytrium kinnereticum]
MQERPTPQQRSQSLTIVSTAADDVKNVNDGKGSVTSVGVVGSNGVNVNTNPTSSPVVVVVVIVVNISSLNETPSPSTVDTSCKTVTTVLGRRR